MSLQSSFMFWREGYVTRKDIFRTLTNAFDKLGVTVLLSERFANITRGFM